MKILLIIDTKTYKYHNEVFVDFETALVNYFGDSEDDSLEVVDVGIDEAEHVIFNYIKESEPDLMITLDFAGFNMLTTGNAISFNSIPCRMAHVLFKGKDSYSNYLKYRQNFSMFTYFPEGENIDTLKGRYNWITNIGQIQRLKYKDLSDKDHENNVSAIEKWLPAAFEDMRL